MQRTKARLTGKGLEDFIGRHGLTRQGAAKVLGVSERALYAYLSGIRPIPQTLSLLCRALDTIAATA